MRKAFPEWLMLSALAKFPRSCGDEASINAREPALEDG
jgi:hypothetical protein